MVPANLYSTFAPYRLGDDFTGCECCVTPRDIAGLAARPLRELTGAELEHYARKAMTTWGNVRHFKHFLPRLLEVICSDEEQRIDTDILFGKLTYAHWRDWPQREQDAVEQFLKYYWQLHLEEPVEYVHRESANDALLALSRAVESMRIFLDLWLQTPTDHAHRQLAAFILLHEQNLFQEGCLIHDFNGHAAEIIAWLCTPATLDYLAGRADVLTGDDVYAIAQLQAIQAALGTTF